MSTYRENTEKLIRQYSSFDAQIELSKSDLPVSKILSNAIHNYLYYTKKLVEWSADFDADPLDALSSGEYMVLHAAKQRVYREVIGMVASLENWADTETMKGLLDEMQRDAMDKCARVPSSTSHMSNLVQASYNAALMNYVRELDWS